MKKIRLEQMIEALTHSLEVVSHNPIETEYVISLREKYKSHYKEMTGRDYAERDWREEWKQYDKLIEGDRA